MRKTTLLLIMAFASFTTFAQTIVDTTAQNKNVILEEFTGIHCVYCPDGHKISSQIQAANPGRFFAINIHTGSYATPSAGEPDFRTALAPAIANQSGLTGYPAGTINRHLFAGHQQGTGTAMSRGDWAATTATTLAQASYVNMAATASINLSTRLMKILVEGYFTGNTAPSTMKLNVAVLQNNVEGPQTGSSYNPTQVLPNGNYSHMHMLREFITGQWGISIDTTTQGTFFSRTFSYAIPANINGVPMELGDLEVVAFIAQGQQEIITGNKATMNYITPAGVSLVDLAIKDLSVVPQLCGTTFTPSVRIKNTSSTVIADSFNVQYVYNGGTPVSQFYTTPLAAGDSITVTFPSVTLSSKVNKFDYKVDVDSAYHLIDMNTGNSLATTHTFYTMPSATMGSIYAEEFESYPTGTTDLNHTIIENPTAASVFTVNSTVSSAVTWDIGGYGASANSLMFDFYSIDAGKSVNIMFEKLNFSGTTHGIKFQYAYAQYSAENDNLQIRVSDNCGVTWTTKWQKYGGSLKTAAPTTARFFPKANEWASANIDLSSYDGKPEVIIAFVGTSDYGNNLYIDNINIYNSTNVGIEKIETNNSLEIYPNPASNKAFMSFTTGNISNVSYSIMNTLGQVIISENLGTLTAGEHTQSINLSTLSSGLYMINMNIDGKFISKKLNVK